MRASWILLLVAGVVVAAAQLGLEQGVMPATELVAFLSGVPASAPTSITVVADWVLSGAAALFLLGFLVFALIDGSMSGRTLARLRRIVPEDDSATPLSRRVADAVQGCPSLAQPIQVLFGSAESPPASRRFGPSANDFLPVELYLGHQNTVDRPMLRRVFEPLPLIVILVASLPVLLAIGMSLLLIALPEPLPFAEMARTSYSAAAHVPLLVAAVVLALTMKLGIGMVLEARYRQTRALLLEIGLLLNEARMQSDRDEDATGVVVPLRTLEEALDLCVRNLETLAQKIARTAQVAPSERPRAPVLGSVDGKAVRPMARDRGDDEEVVSEIAVFIAEAEANLEPARPRDVSPTVVPDLALRS